MSAAVVLLSGGQDSTTCLFWARERFEEVRALGFDYGQRHRVELDYAEQIAEHLGVSFEVIDLSGTVGASSLTDHSQSVEEKHDLDPSLPSTFTPGRNMIFLTVAASYAYGHSIFDLVTGTCQTDFSGYPDCRQVFIESIKTSLSLAMDRDFRIHTPLMYLTKAETWKLAAELSDDQYDVVEIIRTQTMTDYNGATDMNEWGRGRLDNPASKLRAKGYLEAREKGWI